MSKPDTWMPLYIGDYLGDTGRLSTEAHGAYLLMIMDYWRNDAPPDNDEQLATITRLPFPRWRKLRPMLEPFFYIFHGLWVHKKVEELLMEAAENSEKNSKRAKKAADTRWGRDAASNAHSNAPSIPEAVLDECPSPSPSTASNEANQKLLADFDVWYARYPRKVKPEKAKAAYLKARKTVDAETLLAGLETYIRTKPSYADWAHPTSWLNDKRWFDQPDSAPAAPAKTSEAAADPLAKAKTAAWAVKGGHRPLSVSPSDVRAAIAENLITADQAKQAGWSL